MSIREALKFREKYGDKDIMDYTHQTAWKGAIKMTQIWNT
jgi:hypothetical protein